jgi:MFS family permease
MVYVAIFNFFAQILGAIYLVYAVRELELSAGTIGLVFGLGNIGFLAGAVLAPRISARLGIGPTLIGSAALGGFTLFLVPLAPQSNPVPLLLAQGIVLGFLVVLYNVAGISFFQAITPDRMLGRMNASRRFVVWGVIPLGSLAGGVLASTIGLRETLFVAAAGASVAFLPLLFSPLRSLRDMPAGEPAVEHA